MTTLHALTRHVCTLLQENGSALTAAEALVLGGVAFRHYLFDAGINHGWRACHAGVELRPQSWTVDHYGALSALQAHTDHHLVPYRNLNLGEVLRLVEHETQADRSVLMVNRSARGAASLEIVRRFERDGKRFVLHGHTAGADGEATLRPLREKTLTDLGEIRSPWPGLELLLVARPSDERSSDRLRATLRRDVLRYAVQHGRNDKELHADDELYYATSRAAWTHLLHLVRGDVRTEDPTPGSEDQTTRGNETGWPLERLPEFVRLHLDDLAEAREAAGCMLVHWAESEDWSDEERRVMHVAALRWSEAARALVSRSEPTDALPPLTLLEQAAAHDLAGFQALADAFRPGFG